MNPGLDIFKNAQHLQGGIGDFFKPPSKEFGSGGPTERGIGMGVGTLSNFIFPGLGFVTGPLARMAWRMIHSGASKEEVKYALERRQSEIQPVAPKAGPTAAPPTTPSPAPQAGVGIDPWGNPADPGEWWSPDFGRWDLGPSGEGAGGYNLAGPGGGFGYKGIGFGGGFGGHTVGNLSTAIGFGGNLGGDAVTNAGRYMGMSGWSRPFTESQYGALGVNRNNKGYGTWNNQTATAPSYQDYLGMFHAPGTAGSSTGPGGAAYGYLGEIGKQVGGGRGAPMRQTVQMGTSSVNPGLKIFHRTQLKRKKPKL